MRTSYFAKFSMIIFVALIMPVILVQETRAFKISTARNGAKLHWKTHNIVYFVNLAGARAGALGAIKAAMATWSHVGTADFDIYYGGNTNRSGSAYDGTNTISFRPLEQSNTLGVNYYWYNPNTGELLDSDIVINIIQDFDLQNVATHELGHSLSLSDLYGAKDKEKTMYGYFSGTKETLKRTLHQDDMNGIAYLYPKAGGNQNPSGGEQPAESPDPSSGSSNALASGCFIGAAGNSTPPVTAVGIFLMTVALLAIWGTRFKKQDTI